MENETIVRLKIVSTTHTPEQVTQILGMSCDKSWHIGDNRGKTIIKEKTNGWIVGSGLPKSASLEQHVDKLLERFVSYSDKIKTFSSSDEVEFSCVIYASSRPALNFNKDVISKVAQLGASLDIDVYIFDEE